ncbi:hypothetical protein FJP64_14125 [Kosakonia cowanii]|uniref:hypothetical protein n=1 Tax=Kosakonia cowanii TaxID=208223 RepID=UPI00112165DB|nr:hypothetical protein [Kosakonia cowanii]MDP9766986.1 hypothetical protein [Atlantibacter hermannii]TPD64163.1 hypothetical protein FJP70_13310 [Kosakonia cowanii]TPD88495.1 hypothetical protein FJP67_13320 [Kosakonia cowanii]TPE04415.1 hypothetical protein FJP64_14125 [Kosakonia cowanii]
MTKYAKLDDAILQIIGDSPITFSGIFVRDVAQECRLIAGTEKSKPEPFRILDRRLQALRKLGVIRNVTGKGWVKS